jgi:ABC-type multidrug transport system ATPase subunit
VARRGGGRTSQPEGAHRLSTIRHADQIIGLDRGRIVEQGTHDQLLSLHGRYSALLAQDEAGTPQHGGTALTPAWPVSADQPVAT